MTASDPLTRPLSLTTAPRRTSRHWEAEETTWAGLRDMVAGPPAREKEAGNYVLGAFSLSTVDHNGTSCRKRHRVKRALRSRSALTLDADHLAPGDLDALDLLSPWRVLWHSTWSHTPQEPRARLLLPLSRDVDGQTYRALAQHVMDTLGRETFDATSAEPERYMFRPSARDASAYVWGEVDGPALDVDAVLLDLGHSPEAAPVTPRETRGKREPTELEGTVGAFNRAYTDLQSLVDTYDLPYRHVGENRWQLVGSHSMAGMGPVQGRDNLYFSHHANDPANGETCSAFDLVRLHRFKELDADTPDSTPVNRRPSHQAMLDLASTDAAVVREAVGDVFAEELDEIADAVDEDNWESRLKRKPKNVAEILDDIHNWDLISQHHPAFKTMYFNEMSLSVEVDHDLPWRPLSQGGETFGIADRNNLAHALERQYGIRIPRALLDEFIVTAAHRDYRNPVRDYLESLEWDGISRIETCLPGVRDTEYTRLVARKCLTAAAARILEPGIKWDHVLVLYGGEGKGKTHWIDTMTRGNHVPLGRLHDKDTLAAMRRAWVVTSDEGGALRKADADAMKEFVTRREDVFRMPYDRETRAYKRHSVLWATTNDEVFLRRQEGNRRFLMVHCEEQMDFDRYTEEYVDQIWAEAVALYRAGERLYLTPAESDMSAAEREWWTDEDADAALITEWLDTPVPADWMDRTPGARLDWITERDLGMGDPGTHYHGTISAMQVWTEALRHPVGSHRPADLARLAETLSRIENLDRTGERERIPGYGRGRTYRRTDSAPGPLL